MDRVRFGRALGFGARQAVKTLVNAVDAATAENPSQMKVPSREGAGHPSSRSFASGPAITVSSPNPAIPPKAHSTGRKAGNSAAKSATQAHEVKKGLRRGSKRLGEAVWEPFVRLSGVLWLEVSGVFFGLFAVVALGYLWKLRAAWDTGSADAASKHSLFGAAIMFVLFGYFCVSSFVRARRRERRH